jgi:phosphoribosylcarboxyaminoimidazole (NCAIR) mutase
MVADLPGWTPVSADEDALTVVAEKRGALSGTSRITITVDGPEGIPSATVHVHSETTGGLLARDKGHVAEFMTPFQRRVG